MGIWQVMTHIHQPQAALMETHLSKTDNSDVISLLLYIVSVAACYFGLPTLLWSLKKTVILGEEKEYKWRWGRGSKIMQVKVGGRERERETMERLLFCVQAFFAAEPACRAGRGILLRMHCIISPNKFIKRKERRSQQANSWDCSGFSLNKIQRGPKGKR